MEDYQPAKSTLFWACAATVVATLIIGSTGCGCAFPGARPAVLGFLRTFEVISMREPTLLPGFGKLGVKPPVAVAATPTKSKSMEKAASRMRAALSSHGALALKLCVVLWTVAVLAAAFFITRA